MTTAPRPGAAEPETPASALEVFACLVQAAPEEVRWLYAQPDLIRDRSLGANLTRGRWGRVIDFLLGPSRALGLGPFVATAIAAVVCLRMWISSATRHSGQRSANALFVGIGALKEDLLLDALMRHSRITDIEVLNETDPRSFGRLGRPPFRDLLASWRTVVRTARPHLARPALTGFLASDVQRWAALRMGAYVFFHAWFRHYAKSSGVRAIGMSASSSVAFAAVGCGAPVVYLPHGFQRRSLVFPDFAEVHVSNRIDARHFATRLPCARIMDIHPPAALDETRRLALVAGHYGDISELERIGSFLEWARQSGYPVVIRPHPRDQTGYWDRCRGVEGLEFQDAAEPFDATLLRLRPRLLVTWNSTTLFDALVRGVMPITLAADAPHNADIVFPLTEIALPWPSAKAMITTLADDAQVATKAALERRASVLAIAAGSTTVGAS